MLGGDEPYVIGDKITRQSRSPLLQLPTELWAHIVQQTDAPSVLALACTCQEAMVWEADNSEQLWSALLKEQHSTILATLFDGDPLFKRPPEISARRWFSVFTSSWLSLAQQRTGRVLLRLDSRCEDPDAAGWRFQLFGLGSAGRCPAMFTVYDVTSYAPHHPGAERLLLDAASLEDASESFGMGRHSTAARRLLRTMALEGLQGVPYTPGTRPANLGHVKEPWSALLPTRRDLLLVCRDVLWIGLLGSLAQCCHPALGFAAVVSAPWWRIVGSVVLPHTRLWQRGEEKWGLCLSALSRVCGSAQRRVLLSPRRTNGLRCVLG